MMSMLQLVSLAMVPYRAASWDEALVELSYVIDQPAAS